MRVSSLCKAWLRFAVLLALASLSCSRNRGDGDGGVPLASPGRHFGESVQVTPSVTGRLRSIAESGQGRNDAAFMKVGDSITANCNSLCCFATASGQPVDLGGRGALAETIAFFDVPFPTGGESSWNRSSEAASPGVWSAWPLERPGDGRAAPLLREIDAINPRFAVVMIGTNDLAGTSHEHWVGPRGLRAYAANLTAIVDALTARGVIPLLSYIPPIYAEEARRTFTPAFNAIVRGVAVANRVPTIDCYSDMAEIGPSSISPDGIHPSYDARSACILTPEGLRFGFNVRNLRTLEVLHAVRLALFEGEVSAPEAPEVEGAGTASSPLVIASLPFAAALGGEGPNTSSPMNDYRTCGGQGGADGAEWILALHLDSPAPLRIIAVPPSGECEAGIGPEVRCDGSRDVSVALFAGNLEAASCLAAHSTLIERRVPAGDYFVVVDTWRGAKQPENVILTIDRCLAEDSRCTGE
ncbi:MAG: SGNH/GDSL hydrolase family protein [Myxococcales bacterium]|jgi:hypothetical protein